MPTPPPRADTDVEDSNSLASRWLENIRHPIETRLTAVFAAKRAKAEAVHPETVALVEAIADLTSRGGKRIRPALLVGGYHAVAPSEDLDAVLDACISVELLHTYLLVQDDWMDRDEMRRGGQSAHTALGQRFKDPHRGDAAAILAGDLACGYAWEALISAPFTTERLDPAMATFAAIQEEVVLGQFLDLMGVGEVETMHRHKTAGYTVRGPFRIGAHLAGAPEELVEEIDRFALPLGMAFQLKDDLLGTFGDPALTGKPAGNDLREGKRTALVSAALRAEGMQGPDRAALEKVLGNRTASDAEISEARALFEGSGIKSKVEADLERYFAEALEKLEAVQIEDRGKNLLRGLANLLVRRDH